MTIHEMLQTVCDRLASDLHLIAGSPATIRVDGKLLPIDQEPMLTGAMTQQLIQGILTPEQQELFLANKEIDFSYQFGEAGRFRVNVYHQRGVWAAAFRLIPTTIKSLEELKLPAVYQRFAHLRQGFVLITGPTGHGKSSSLAAIIEHINHNRAEHVLTIEDPIEFIYKADKCVISQRELHGDTHSWQVALRSALREDPDVVLV